METNQLFFKGFDDVDEGHKELVKLSLSMSTSLNPVSSSSSSGRQRLQLNIPCDSISSTRSLSASFDGEEDDHEELLNLSLSIGPPQPAPLAASASHHQKPSRIDNPNLEEERVAPVISTAGSSRSSCHQGRSSRSSYHQGLKVRRNPFQLPKRGKSETIAAPYPWVTTRRATVYSLENLLSRGISIISGDLECKQCQETLRIQYNLQQKFKGIKDFVSANRFAMNNRAPEAWMNPKLDNCRICGNSLKPVFTKKKDINWLFLLLGQMLGCCKISELKYFCKHTKNHRTGAKDRLLYLTYLTLCRQLDPDGPFDV